MLKILRITLIFSLLNLLILPLWAQEAAENKDFITISGYIKDADNLETLLGATIYIQELQTGATTNGYGYYAIKVPMSEDSLTLKINYLGYIGIVKRVLPTTDVPLSIELKSNAELLKEIVVTEDANRLLIEETQMGVQKVTSKQIKTIPVVFGEADILKVVQMMAGVQTGAEGTSGFYVRGGGYDQNLILLDEATVYNPEHFFGFFSTFNADIVKNLEIYKSDFPAKYGGRLSSVLDVQMRDGNMKDFSVQGGIGLISSRLTLEGPIVKDKSSFVLSGRRTYFDLFTPIANRSLSADQQIPNYYFYDLNAKVNFILGDKDRIYVSGYFGRDKMNIEFGNDAETIANSSYRLQWGNLTGTVRWNHVFNPRLFSNTSLVASRFNYRDNFIFDDFFQFKSSSETYTYSLKQDFDYFLNTRHHIKFGAQLTHNIIRPIEFSAGTIADDDDLQSDAISEVQDFLGEEISAYLLDDWKINSKLALKFGLRFSGFLTRDDKFFHQFEPRAAFNYQLNERTALKGSYARMAQYLHQVKYSYLSFLDPWFPSNGNVKPQLSDQVSLGWTRLFLNDAVSITNEFYYKWMYNQLEYQNGADFLFIDENYHERLAVGQGRGYGAELQVQKNKGKLTGWVAYTLAWSRRKFDDLNGGEPFPFTYDRRHVLNLVLQYELPKNWSFSGNFTYRSGIALDLAVGRIFTYGVSLQDPAVIPIYGEVNSFRMPAYHRLDIGFIKKFKRRKNFESELAISIYNVYSRRNPFFIYYDQEQDEETDATRFVAKQTSLFPIIPSVSYNFKF